MDNNTQNKTAFIAFYTVYPSNMGSSEVSSSFFESWAGNKKIFQISHLTKINNNKIQTSYIKKEKPLNKIFKIPAMVFLVKKYLSKSKIKNVIIEGPSWIGYSFVFFILSKIFIPGIFYIYHAHSIEYEIRKKNSNFFIAKLTKWMEKFVIKFVNISTSVSSKEQKKIKKLYGIKTKILPNGINIKKFTKYKTNIKLPKRYIFYSGSYLYGPNKEAINLLNNFFMPKLIKIFPKIKLILTGGGYKLKHDWLINLNIVKKELLIKILKKASLILVPIYEGYGTRIKIIEALMLGVPIVSTPKGIEGIEYQKNKTKIPYVDKNKKKLLKYSIKIIKNNKIYKTISIQNKKIYINNYSMNSITKKFQHYVKKIKYDK